VSRASRAGFKRDNRLAPKRERLSEPITLPQQESGSLGSGGQHKQSRGPESEVFPTFDHLLDRKPWAALTLSDLGDVQHQQGGLRIDPQPLFDDVVRRSEANDGRISVMFDALKASDDMEGDSMTRRISIVFSAGALGGLLNALLFWLFGMVGITALVGMHAPIKWDPRSRR